MTRITRFIAGALFCALVFTTPVQAQGCPGNVCSNDISATVSVQAVLTCFTTRNFDFGSHPASAGSIESNEANHGRVQCSTDAGNSINVSFTLPSSLTGTGGSVPITYGAESGAIYPVGSGQQIGPFFDPALGTTGRTVPGDFEVVLGQNGPNNPANGVFVNLTGAAPGSYSGIITVQIALQ